MVNLRTAIAFRGGCDNLSHLHVQVRALAFMATWVSEQIPPIGPHLESVLLERGLSEEGMPQVASMGLGRCAIRLIVYY